MLPDYQKAHPKYDKLLPIISKYINQNEMIIDIGANVGDTLAAMVDENPNPIYLCIEPEDEFYSYLLRNVDIIQKKIPNLKVYLLKQFVGKQINNVSLDKKGGTANAKLISGFIDEIESRNKIFRDDYKACEAEINKVTNEIDQLNKELDALNEVLRAIGKKDIDDLLKEQAENRTRQFDIYIKKDKLKSEKNQNDKDVSLDDFKGSRLLIWFYPKASTPG